MNLKNKRYGGQAVPWIDDPFHDYDTELVMYVNG